MTRMFHQQGQKESIQSGRGGCFIIFCHGQTINDQIAPVYCRGKNNIHLIMDNLL